MKTITSSAIDFLRHLPLFQDMSESDLLQLNEMVVSRVYAKQEVIFEAGSPSDTVLFLIKGIVKIGAQFDDGREVIKHVLYPMAMFGELSLVGEERRQDFAIAMEDVQIFSLRADAFRRLMQFNPELSMRLLTLIGNRLRRTESRLESLILKDARERIIDFLRDSALKQGKQIGFEMLIKHCLTQQDIANITGTSRQTVTSVLNELRKSNLIYFNRRSILIRDLAKLS